MRVLGLSLFASGIIALISVAIVIRRRLRNPSPTRGLRILVGRLNQLLKVCPACGKRLDGHLYTSFAVSTAYPEDESTVLRFLNALREHRWNDISAFGSFDVWEDAYVAGVIRCQTRTATLVLTLSPEGIGARPVLVRTEVLDTRLSQGLLEYISARRDCLPWMRFGSALLH
jgi:hypothetical protein